MNTIKSHLRYIGISDADIALLRSARPLIEEHVNSFIERFYGHLQAFESTKALLTDKKTVDRLLAGQRNYVLSLFEANFDEKYYEFRRVIGHTHFRIGLDFRWYIGAYALYLDFFMPLLQKYCDPSVLSDTQAAFRKATLLDMSIVLEAYHDGDKAALVESKNQVIQQEKLAAVGLLASGLAHEIGNPLASIQVICDNQLRKNPDPVIADKLTRIRSQVVKITSIVGQLVGFARPKPEEWRRININESVESSLTIARLSRSAKTVDVKSDLSLSLPELFAIGDQLTQVFLNLFLNAFDAMPETGGMLTVRSFVSSSGKVTVEVEDNGSGMTDVVLSKIFVPFYSTKEIGKGTGLGLHVSDGIVKRHGGTIEVRSDAGAGSVFIVAIPILDVPPA